MTPEVQLFLKIIERISDGKVRATSTDPLNTIFHSGLQPLEFELALYSLEATLRREIDSSFYEGTIEDYLLTPIEEFLSKHLSKTVNCKSLFITETFMKFYKSAEWEYKEINEPGQN